MPFEQLQTGFDDGPCPAAERTGAAVSTPDLTKEDRFPLFTPVALQEGLVAVFTFPLRHGDRRLGALDLYGSVVGSLSSREMAAHSDAGGRHQCTPAERPARDELQSASDGARRDRGV